MEIDRERNAASPGGMPRDADIFSTQLDTVAPPSSENADPIEFWAKRIGRLIGLVLVAVLALNLATGWFF